MGTPKLIWIQYNTDPTCWVVKISGTPLLVVVSSEALAPDVLSLTRRLAEKYTVWAKSHAGHGGKTYHGA